MSSIHSLDHPKDRSSRPSKISLLRFSPALSVGKNKKVTYLSTDDDWSYRREVGRKRLWMLRKVARGHCSGDRHEEVLRCERPGYVARSGED
ncbi:polypyrimidine tract-binding protein 1-like X12, partial [Biomphalaria pfeifferi]